MTRTVLALATLLALAACTNANGTGSAGGVAEDYLHDLANRNYAAACALLTDNLRGQLGDCASTLGRRHGDLPVADLDELRDVTVDHVTYHGSSQATVFPQDVKIRHTVTVKVHGTPTPRATTARSIAANHATDGKGLELTKDSKGWRISGGGV